MRGSAPFRGIRGEGVRPESGQHFSEFFIAPNAAKACKIILIVAMNVNVNL